MSQSETPAGDSGPGMLREARLAEVFAELADTLVDDFDVVDFLSGLTRRSVELLGAAQAGVMLADSTDTLQPVAASSEQGWMLELFQVQHRQGPCLDCYAQSDRVVVEDLEAARERWPEFADRALEAGFGSVLALPMRLRDRTVGGLNLFRAGAGEIGAAEQTVAQAMADIATVGLLQERAVRESRLLADQLRTALDARIAIEQAKGMLTERTGVDMEVAFEQLRSYARSHNRKLREVANDLLAGELRALELPVVDQQVPSEQR